MAGVAQARAGALPSEEARAEAMLREAISAQEQAAALARRADWVRGQAIASSANPGGTLMATPHAHAIGTVTAAYAWRPRTRAGAAQAVRLLAYSTTLLAVAALVAAAAPS